MGRRAARRGLGGFLADFADGYKVVGDVLLQNDIGQVEKTYTPTETPVASGEEAMSAATQARDQALSGATDDAQRQQIEQNFKPTLDALEGQRKNPSGTSYSMGAGQTYQQRDTPFSEGDVASARAQARHGIYARAGREEDAGRVMRNEAIRRALADDTELRAAMTPTPQRNQNALMASAATDMSDLTASNFIPQSATGQVDRPITAAGVVASKGIPTARDPLDHYLRDVAPKAVQTLVKQGHIEEAKRYADFLDSREGIEYARAYTKGLRQYAVGDHEGAMQHFEKLYNDDLYPDGRKVKLTPMDGDRLRIDQIGADGNVIGSKTGSMADLSEQAALALNPLQAVKFIADQNAKRQDEAATLNRQIQLEKLRQEGQDSRDDRRDERLGMRLDAQGRQLERRLASGGSGGLTAAQERSNAEIDAAREAVAGLTPQDIMRRTAKATNTGRENPDYDPGLARQAGLANRRKIGDDEFFDGRSSKQPSAGNQAPSAPKAAGTPKERALSAMANDPAMQGFSLGAFDGRRFKVLDSSGKHVGYYGGAR